MSKPSPDKSVRALDIVLLPIFKSVFARVISSLVEMGIEKVTFNSNQPKRTSLFTTDFRAYLLILWLIVFYAGEVAALGSEHNLQQVEIDRDSGLDGKFSFIYALQRVTYYGDLTDISINTKHAVPDVNNRNQLHSRLNPLTCFLTDQSGEDKCIQVIQAQFDWVYNITLNSTLEFRLIYTFSDVSHVSFACLKISLIDGKFTSVSARGELRREC